MSNFEQIHGEGLNDFLYYLLHCALLALLLDHHLALPLLPLLLGTRQLADILHHLGEAALPFLGLEHLANIAVEDAVDFLLDELLDSGAVAPLCHCLAHEGVQDGDLLHDETQCDVVVGVRDCFDEVAESACHQDGRLDLIIALIRLAEE